VGSLALKFAEEFGEKGASQGFVRKFQIRSSLASPLGSLLWFANVQGTLRRLMCKSSQRLGGNYFVRHPPSERNLGYHDESCHRYRMPAKRRLLRVARPEQALEWRRQLLRDPF
jgi:hypothetical protein